MQPIPRGGAKLVVDPIVPGKKKNVKAPKLKNPNFGGEKPYPMPQIKDKPGMYSPIKSTKQVNRVYNTY
jgi:hypothetical protein